MLQAGMLVNGRYEISGLIGKGGMSQVFRAKDRITGADLAIKEALKTAVKDNRTAELGLSAEGNLLKKLSNPHLPRIYDVIEDRDDIMIVMDYVEGQSLDKVLKQFGPISPEKVMEWSIQICEVFHYLHTQNPPIIYRDMKPANVILQPNGNIMMIDFGTARSWKVDANRTSDTILIGTEGYAAPEQFGGRGQSDARTDIFCLGATMFNLVTNHSPYLKPFGITPLGNWNPALENCALDRIIQKCTANDPYARFQTAEELRQALIAALATPEKTGFLLGLGLHKKGNTRKTKGWQAPVMKESTGDSRVLSPAQWSNTGDLQSNEHLKGKLEKSGQLKEKSSVFNDSIQDDRLQQTRRAQQANAIVVQQSPISAAPAHIGEGTFVEQSMKETTQEVKADVFTWKMLTLTGLIAGVILIILAVLLLIISPVAGIVLAFVAVAVAVFGVISAIKYTNIV